MHLQTAIKLIRIRETLFGLPWVFSSLLLALLISNTDYPIQLSLQKFLWIVLAFVSARTAGMSFNRVIDRKIDKMNPRTSDRLVPSGSIKTAEVWGLSIGSVGLFIFSCWMINKTCFFLSPFIALLLFGYSYTKRFTSFCHIVLALILSLGPVCGWLAVMDQMLIAPTLLSIALFCSIAACDIVYAFQDYDFDRENKIYSIPAAIGIKRSCILARFLHIGTLTCLTLMGISCGFGPLFYSGVLATGLMYYQFYSQINPNKPSTIPQNFMMCNMLGGFFVLLALIGEMIWNVL